MTQTVGNPIVQRVPDGFNPRLLLTGMDLNPQPRVSQRLNVEANCSYFTRFHSNQARTGDQVFTTEFDVREVCYIPDLS